MSDEIDAAQDMEARIRAAELQRRGIHAWDRQRRMRGLRGSIPPSGQRAAPWATRCIGCQEAAERHGRGITCRAG